LVVERAVVGGTVVAIGDDIVGNIDIGADIRVEAARADGS
jgi:hypothetical protein